MKKTMLTFLTILLLASCSKDNSFETPTTSNQLPPATTVGANTVGCLVNGEVFLPHKNNPFGSSPITCFYQFVNGAYHFSLGFSNDQRTRLRGVNVASHNTVLQQGQIYPLILESNNSVFGTYYDFMQQSDFNTSNSVGGELKITKLDQANAIISGTFWFNAISSNGEIIHITEGRFDLHYTP